MGEKASCRLMRASDLDAVMALDRQAFFDPWSEATWRHELETALAAWYVLELPEQGLAGYAGLWNVAGEGQVMRVAVDPAARCRGYGRRLTEQLLARAWAEGCTAVTLEVRESNAPAQAVYRRCGFRPAGVRPHYYADNGEGALIMWLYRKDTEGAAETAPARNV
ncbi:MAG: ribosomal protein S18-alanine N-acetyltransferase [Succiniclasticum sp.]|jgi:ribosomal-protein-alanine N-acetyltransferase|nr:ribosomal protein S18-alanine N-acetyltransferase [Succiniclasticum sp.]MEE3478951.1 ribosomal protein S18-alanine N-acetyltransferase [Succiniclasticum sp.]